MEDVKKNEKNISHKNIWGAAKVFSLNALFNKRIQTKNIRINVCLRDYNRTELTRKQENKISKNKSWNI